MDLGVLTSRGKELDINNKFINLVEATIIARKYLHKMQSVYENDKSEYTRDKLEDIYDDLTIELEEDAIDGLLRDYIEITGEYSSTENQIKRIYYELRRNKERLSFSDADNIIKILKSYEEEI